MATAQETRKIELGEFIEIPAWNVIGVVIDIEPARYGSDYAQRVLVLTDPEDETGTWFHLEPDQFVFEN